MRIVGKLKQSGEFWLVSIPILDTGSQGSSRDDALDMAKDLVECFFEPEDGFEATVTPVNKTTFSLSSNNTALLIGLILKRRRQQSGLSLADVAERLGVTSAAVAEGEHGAYLCGCAAGAAAAGWSERPPHGSVSP
jgi:hypothetical protein